MLEEALTSLELEMVAVNLARELGPRCGFAHAYEVLAEGGCAAPGAACVLACDDFNRELGARYAAAVRAAGHLSVGLLSLENVVLAGSRGLVCLPAERKFLAGSALGWEGTRYLTSYAANELRAGLDTAMNVLRLPAPAVAAEVAGPVILLASPGMLNYGHWLVDHVPRLHLLHRSGMLGRHPLAVPALPAWAMDILSVFGLGRKDLLVLKRGSHLRVGTLIVPTYATRGDLHFGPFVKSAWGDYRERLLRGNVRATRAARIFVSRRRLGEGRRLVSYDEPAALLARSGFVELSPELLGLPEQAAAFDAAEATVGEQGSAMHNLVFSQPGSRHLVMMQAGKAHLRHIAVADALGLRLAYVPLEGTDSAMRVDLDALSRVLQALLAS